MNLVWNGIRVVWKWMSQLHRVFCVLPVPICRFYMMSSFSKIKNYLSFLSFVRCKTLWELDVFIALQLDRVPQFVLEHIWISIKFMRCATFIEDPYKRMLSRGPKMSFRSSFCHLKRSWATRLVLISMSRSSRVKPSLFNSKTQRQMFPCNSIATMVAIVKQ